MRGTRARKRGRPPKTPNTQNNGSRYVYSSKSNRDADEDDEDSNQSSSTTNTSTSKYPTRASRKPSYRIGITIERKKTQRKRRKNEESEEEEDDVDYTYAIEPENQSESNEDDDDTSEEEEVEIEEEEETEEEGDQSHRKRLRPNRDAAPLFLDDAEIPELILPSSSEDLLITGKELMRALSIYEILRHFHNTLRVTPFRFEDFCVSLLIDEQTFLLSEIHIGLLKALIREDDLVGTQHGSQDIRDSIQIYLYLCDHITWPEVLRIYLSSDLKKNSHIIKNCLEVNYPFSPIQNKLDLLEHLCDEFLNTQSSREVLNNEGLIKHEDTCRVCYKPGDLLCCEHCPAVFHLNCLDPPLKQVPNEEWICPICKLNTVTGVTDCLNDYEKHGFLPRQEPIGWDRHGRKYWFLSRRIIVEDQKSEENIFYYSTRLQLDELLNSLDEDNYESDLCRVLNEMKEEIYRQMAITEKLTKTAKGSRKSYLEAINEELYIKRAAKLKSENAKDENLTVNDEKYAELESKLAVDDDDLRGGVLTRLKTGSLQPKSITLDPFKNRVNVYNSINTFREEDTVIILNDDSKTLTRTPRKALPTTFNQTNLFKLGLEGNYRQYQNIYYVNQFALNKYQLGEDRDKKRHLSHKFSLTQPSELKWGTYTHINTAIMTSTLHGTKPMLINILRQALLYLETQFTQTFMHPNWQVHRNNWIKAVSMCSEPKEFSLALYILESSMKPVLFNTAWHDTLGFTVLQRSTLAEREELKKKDKKERRDLNETTTADSETSSRYYGAGVGVKLVFGKLKHQIWKQKGEEFRLSGIGGWNWLSSTRIKSTANEKLSIEKELCPNLETSCSLIDISKSLQQRELPARKLYPKLYQSSKLDSLLKSRVDMFNLEKKRLAKEKDAEPKKDSFTSQCYSSYCDSSKPNLCYSPLCLYKSKNEASKNDEDNESYGDTSEHIDLLQVTTVDGVEQFSKKTIPFNAKGQLPPSSRFFNGTYRSILILPAHETRKLGRNGGLREVNGFSYNSKTNNVWPYGLTPRPFFRTIWLLRTHYLNNLHSAALQLRVFWASVRWDDLATKPPVSGTNTITTESEVQTVEILKRRDLPPFGLRSEYLIRKIIVPLDLPVKQREVSTPNRSGLRERRRPESPQVKGPRITELWINEEDLELWEIKQFGEKAEKQQQLAKQRAAQEEKQRNLELLRKKNEEQKKLTPDSAKMVNGSISINPAKSITSRFSNIFRGNPRIIGSPITVSNSHISTSNTTLNSPNVTTTFATIRTAAGATFKIPVQNKQNTTQQLFIRPGTQIITANNTNQSNIANASTVTNRPATATYIVRSPNLSTNRPIIISNSLNGPIVRPINTIQTNIKQSIPLISPNTPQKISTMTTVNAILTTTPSKTIVTSLGQTASPATPTGTIISNASTSLGAGKNIQCVPVKLSDGRLHYLPISSLSTLTGSSTVQFAVANSSGNQIRLLTKPADNKDGTNKQILMTGNSILNPNTIFLSNVNNTTKIVVQQANSPQITTTANISNLSAVNKTANEPPKATVKSTPVVVSATPEPVAVKSAGDTKVITSPTSSTVPRVGSTEEKEFVLTAEMTQDIIRKALMNSNLQPDLSQKLIAYQRHHQEMSDSQDRFTAPHSPAKPFTTAEPVSRSSHSRSSRSSRYSRGKYDSDDYIIDFPKNDRNDRNASHPEEDEVERVCRGVIKYMVDKIDKEERRMKNREIAEERRQKKATLNKLKYRQNHIELLRRSIIRRKAKLNQNIKACVEKEFASKIPKAKRVVTTKTTTPAPINISVPPAVDSPLTASKRKFEEEPIFQSVQQVTEIKADSSSPAINHAEPKPKRARASSTASHSNSLTPKKITPKSSPKSRTNNKEQLYCICQQPYDKRRIMIGCDSCTNWFHPGCIKIDETLIKDIPSYTCDICKTKKLLQSTAINNSLESNITPAIVTPVVHANKSARRRTNSSRSGTKKPQVKIPVNNSIVETNNVDIRPQLEQGEHDDSLYCVCRKVYDPAQFYICCDQCQDWFHGRCVGVTSAEAESIGEYICPQCEGDNSINYLNLKDLSDEDYSNMLKLLKSIQAHKSAWPFQKPVDKRHVPDYYTIIKEPMDLKKIETRLQSRAYKKLAEFIYDMNKMFDNCRLYNGRNSDYYQCAESLEGFFVGKLKAYRENAKFE